jgi:hypothetical protein
MVKLTISHAIAQSVKMTLFEGLIENTINATKNIPQTMAETGKVPMSRYEPMHDDDGDDGVRDIFEPYLDDAIGLELFLTFPCLFLLRSCS